MPDSGLVPLRTGDTAPPFFLVHPAHGGILCYAPLVRSLRTRRSVYCFRSKPPKAKESEFTSVETMALHYSRLLKEIQPAGPYYLGGWSLGAAIALEIGHVLRRAGDEVALVVSIDNPLYEKSVWIDRRVMLLKFIFNSGYSEDLFDGLKDADSTEGKLEFIIDAAYARGIFPSQLPRDQGRERIRASWSNWEAGWYYAPKPGGLPVAFICADQPVPGLEEWNWYKGWEGKDAVIVHGSNHMTILSAPFVRTVALHVDELLR